MLSRKFSRLSAAARAFLVITCLAVRPAAADEIWLAPTLQPDLGGLGVAHNVVWPVTALGAVRFALGVPDNLQQFTGARLVLIPKADATASTVTVWTCAAAAGQAAVGACEGPTVVPYTGTAGQLIEVDVTASLASQILSPGATNIALIAYTEPTTLTDQIVGMRFGYQPRLPANVATLGANTFTGTQTATAFVGDGSGLTNLPFPAGAATLGTNTFTGPQTAAAFVGDGSGLTNLPVPAGVATLGPNTFTGTQAIRSGNLELDSSTAISGNITKDGVLFLHDFGHENTFLGRSAGNLSLTGGFNTGVGASALRSLTTGTTNTAVGTSALERNSTGTFNVAVGAFSLYYNQTASNLTAVGYLALRNNVGGTGNVGVGMEALRVNENGSDNTAVGHAAMKGWSTSPSDINRSVAVGFAALSRSFGDQNTGIGENTLSQLGSAGGTAAENADNTALGSRAGFHLTRGTGNLYLANQGRIQESLTTRIGETQTRAFIAGVRGVTPANGDVLPVLIDSAGQLGTVSPLAVGAGLSGSGTSASPLTLATAGASGDGILGITTQRCAGPETPVGPGVAFPLTCGVSHPLALAKRLVLPDFWVPGNGCIVAAETPRVVMVGADQAVTVTLTNRCATFEAGSNGGLTWLIVQISQ